MKDNGPGVDSREDGRGLGAGWVQGRELWALARQRFSLGRRSRHGPGHWKRVCSNGLALAPETGANVVVIELFAGLHDCLRQSEFRDPGHGPRAAELAARLRGVHYDLPDKLFAKLIEALDLHDRGLTSTDLHIGSCWDADRLDLPRVGIGVDPQMLSTDAGRRLLQRRLEEREEYDVPQLAYLASPMPAIPRRTP